MYNDGYEVGQGINCIDIVSIIVRTLQRRLTTNEIGEEHAMASRRICEKHVSINMRTQKTAVTTTKKPYMYRYETPVEP